MGIRDAALPDATTAISASERPVTVRAYTVVFDGDCRVCMRMSRMLRSWDTTQLLEITTSQEPGVKARFAWIPDSAYAAALQLIAANGTTWQGAAAIEQVIHVLPRGRWIGWMYRVPLARPLADRFYRWFARNRYRLGCGDHCQLRPAQTRRPGTFE
ncbi:MAG: DCC1-like thiol-disulfide oxidoreductase family protein [bacterium]